MKKKLIALGIVGLSITHLNAQTYTLSKGVTVGCANANPITDISKKIDLAIDGNHATFTLSSLNCQKQYKGTALKLENEASAYIDTKENKAVIITKDDRIALVAQNSGNYEVVIGGHLDKKSAKLVNTQDLNTELKGSLSKFPSLLEEAKKEAERAEMQAKMLPIPSGDYSDKYGMGGLYYFSEPMLLRSHNNDLHGKYAQAVLFHFDESDNYTLKAYITDKVYDKFYFDGSRMFKAFKEGKVNNVLFHAPDNMNNIQAFKSALTKLEDGIYMIGGFLCSEASEGTLKTHKKEQYTILGKDKSRVDFLAKNPAEVEKLAMISTVTQCKLQDALEAADKPMPAASSLNTPQLSKEATELTQKWAQARWSQELQYVFVSGKEWFIHRNKVTGIILARGIWCVAIMKEKDGSCRWEEVYIKQDFDGSNYGKSYFANETTVIVPVDCTTAMKYKK